MIPSPQNPWEEKGTQSLHLSGMTPSPQKPWEEKGTQSLHLSGMTPRTQASLLKEIKCSKDTYTILYDLDRQEGRKIFEQTGLEIPFAPGQQEIENYIIGKGSFGELRIGYATEQKRYVAIKITQGMEAAAETEIQKVLSGQPFIMSFLDAHESINSSGEKLLCQVMPLAGLGNADQLIPLLQEVDPALREQLLFCIAKGFLQGIAKMHEFSIIHLDLKASNLVIDEKGHPLIIDFGCSQKASEGKIDAKKTGGTQVYLSPARWLRCKKEASPIVTAEEGQGYDAWAAGLTLYVLATNCPYPFSPEQVISILKNSSPDKHKENIEAYFAQQLALIPELSNPDPESYWALIKELLDPVNGLSVRQALAHPWFAKMEVSSGSWIQEAQNHLRELVQSVNREKRQEKAPVNVPQQTSYATLSPQDLPHAHFAAFVERTTLQSTLQERLLKMSIQPLAITVCQGMGGVGKSQLAIRMLHDEKMKDHFGLRLWFQGADRPEMLEVQHLLLARELRLVDEKASPEKALKALHAYLASYAKQSGKPWLAIYDNADSPSLLQPYLAEGGHVLITTRNNEWPNAMSVDVFEPMEAEALTVKLLQLEDPAAKTLCEELGHLALGIVQACAYIRHESLSISQYVEKLRLAPKILEQDERLFGKKLPSSMMKLWRITFETLKKSCPDALTLLHAVAYLAPDPIPEKVLSDLASPTALEAALQYALLQKSETGSSMHRLTQRVLRLKDGEEEKVGSLQQVLQSVNQAYTEDPIDLSQRACNKQLLSHGQALIVHAEAFKALPTTLESLLVSTYLWLGDLQGELAQPFLKKNLLEKGLVLAKLTHGEESPEVARMLNNLGLAWKALGESQNAITYYEKAMAIDIKAYGDQHPNVAIDLNNLGSAWDDLGKSQKAITYFEQAMAIGIKAYGDQHPKVAAYLNNIGLAWKALGEYQKAITYLEKSLAIDIKAYGDQHPNVGRDLNNLGQAWKDLGEDQKAIAYFEKALAIGIKNYGDQHPTVAATLNNLGLAWKDLGESEKAITYFKKALAIDIKAYGDQHPKVARDLNNLGSVCDDLGESQNAITYFEKAMAIDIKAYGDQHPNVATFLNNIGLAWKALGEAQKALTYLEKALAIVIKTYGDQHPTVAIHLNNLGSACADLGESQKAITYYEKAMAIGIKTYSDQHPTVATSLNNLGLAWKALGKSQKAMTYFEKALAINIKAYGDQHPTVATFLNNIGLAWQALGESQKAITYLEKAMAIGIKAYGDQHPTVAASLNNIGLACVNLGKSKSAITYYEKALVIDIKAYGDQHPNVAIRLNNIGLAWQALGESQKAITYFEKTLAIHINTYGDQHPTVALYLNNLGSACADLGESQKAITYFEKALAIDIKTYGDQHPTVARDLNNIGSASTALGEYRKATKYCEQAYGIGLVVWGKDHPNTLAMKNNLEALKKYKESPNKEQALKYSSEGVKFYQEKDYNQAIERYNKALELIEQVPDSLPSKAEYKTKVLFNRARAFDNKGELELAINDYQAVIELDPNHPKVQNCLSQAQAIKKLIEQSLKHTSEGVRFYNAKVHHQAIEEYNKALELIEQVPDSFSSKAEYKTKILFNRARAFDNKGELELAINDYQAVIDLNPTHVKALDYLKQCLVRAKK
jgi:tetratricopeptide (TPR) repeat protein